MTYSYTQLAQYLACPLRYRYRYLDGWQEKETRAGLLSRTLGGQSPLHAEGGVHAGGRKGTDRAGFRTERADLFQGYDEPGTGD